MGETWRIQKACVKALSVDIVLKARTSKCLHTSGVNFAIDVKSIDTI
jgi:hypothetical protein